MKKWVPFNYDRWCGLEAKTKLRTHLDEPARLIAVDVAGPHPLVFAIKTPSGKEYLVQTEFNTFHMKMEVEE